jgi:hypothetical protein
MRVPGTRAYKRRAREKGAGDSIVLLENVLENVFFTCRKL